MKRIKEPGEGSGVEEPFSPFDYINTHTHSFAGSPYMMLARSVVLSPEVVSLQKPVYKSVL